MDAHSGVWKAAGTAAAVALALSALAPGARSARAAEAGASEDYRVSGSGSLTYSARITASEDYLTGQVCDDFAARLRTVFGLGKEPKASYTGATYDGGTSECAVQPFDIRPADSVITENGSERTIAMASRTTGPVLEAIGFTTRSATATVSNAIITSASDGCAVDHDSSSSGRETAVCAQSADDLYVTYDVAKGATSSGAVHAAPTPSQPDPEARTRPQRTGTPSASATPSTPGPITAPVIVGSPGQRGGAATPTAKPSDSDDHDAFVVVLFLILVLLVLIGIVSRGTMRARRTARSPTAPARQRADRPRADPGEPADPYGADGAAAPEPYESPAPAHGSSGRTAPEADGSPIPAPGSAGASEAAAPRSDSRFAPPGDPT